MRAFFLVLMIIVLILAFNHSFMSPSVAEREKACVQKCQAEGYRSYEFTPPGISNPKSQVIPESCSCLR